MEPQPKPSGEVDGSASPPYCPEHADIKLPGFGLPLGDEGDGNMAIYNKLCYFGWHPRPFPIRERCMMLFLDEITSKPNWHEKVHDQVILAKWMKEALEQGRWDKAGIEGGDFDESMLEYCLAELEEKAVFFKATGFVTTFDRSTAVAKSDTLVPDELKEALKKSAWPLEDLPDSKKDWHPGSDGKVLDLVHPSLWPVVYGLTRILPDRKIGLEDCLEAAGAGVVIPKPQEHPAKGRHENMTEYWSDRFQWLPCNVVFPEGKANIKSYINNLHPHRHRDLYRVVEQFIDIAIPMWDAVFAWTCGSERYRVDKDAYDIQWICNAKPRCQYECSPWSRRFEEGDGDDDGDDDGDGDEEWFERTHKIRVPRPNPYEKLPVKAEDVLGQTSILKKAMEGKGLQLIVKLANIHLSPEKQKYEGGSWHVEGQLNEHIAATALYYYDSDNITESRLGFRAPVSQSDLEDDLEYSQGDDRGIKAVWGIDNWERCIQDVGSVATKEGRLLVFPNLYQHRVMPFELADKTKPGHRKILALFLINPGLSIISTANVPPQRLDWWGEKVVDETQIGDLPVEIGSLVLDQIEDFPYGLDKAKELREELMATRTVFNDMVETKLEHWSFCEH